MDMRKSAERTHIIEFAADYSSGSSTSSRQSYTPSASTLVEIVLGESRQIIMPPKQATPRRRLRGCTLFFFLYMSHGIAGPYLPIIWRDKGLSDRQIGMMSAVRAMVSFVSSPVASAIADRTARHQEAVYALLVFYAFSRPSVLMAGRVSAVVSLEILASIFENPINSLVDSATRNGVGAGGYGKQRLWGALGFGLASLIGGYVYDAGPGSYRNVAVAFVVVVMIALAASTRVRMGRWVEPDDYLESRGSSKGHSRGNDYGATQELVLELGETETESDGDASGGRVANVSRSKKRSADTKGYRADFGGSMETETLLRKKGGYQSQSSHGKPPTVWEVISTMQSASLFSAVVLSGMGSGVIETFLFIRLDELGGSHTLLGVSRLVMCLAEMPFFYVSGPMIRHMGARGVIGLSQVAYLTRFLYYSVLTQPWWVLPAETLHGLTFATMWAATIEYANEIAPPGQQASVVGIASGLHYGLGVGLGALMGGILYATLGASLCFRVCTVLPSLSMTLLAVPAVHRCLKHGATRWKEVRGETCL